MKKIRKGVDYIGVTCVFYCHDGQGKFLLHQRSDKCKDEQLTWDCGGGSLEFGEGFEEGVKREIKEEYGCEILSLKFAGVSNVLRKNREGLATHWVALIYLVQLDPAQVKLGDPEKMLNLGWFKPEEFPNPRHSMLARHFKLVENLVSKSP